METFVSNSDGTWQSSNFILNEGPNLFSLRGYDTPTNRGTSNAIVTYDPEVEEITTGTKQFVKPALISKESVQPITLISGTESDPPKKKKSGGGGR